MPSLIARIVLFLSSYAPLIPISFFLLLDDHRMAAIVVLLVGFLAVLMVPVYIFSVEHSATMQVNVMSVEQRDGDVASYVVTYIIPFLVLPSDGWAKAVGLGIFLLVVGILYVKSNMIYINPVLALLGYHLFAVTIDDGSVHPVIVRRVDLHNGMLRVVALGTYVMYAKESSDDVGI